MKKILISLLFLICGYSFAGQISAPLPLGAKDEISLTSNVKEDIKKPYVSGLIFGQLYSLNKEQYLKADAYQLKFIFYKNNEKTNSMTMNVKSGLPSSFSKLVSEPYMNLVVKRENGNLVVVKEQDEVKSGYSMNVLVKEASNNLVAFTIELTQQELSGFINFPYENETVALPQIEKTSLQQSVQLPLNKEILLLSSLKKAGPETLLNVTELKDEISLKIEIIKVN